MTARKVDDVDKMQKCKGKKAEMDRQDNSIVGNNDREEAQ